MYDQISSNIWKSWLLLFFFFAVVIGLGFVFSQVIRGPWSAIAVPAAVILAVVMSVGGYYNSDKIVLSMSGAYPADGPEYAHLRNSVEGIALAAGMPAPRVYVIDDPSPNAFATGRDPEHGVVCVTTGIMSKLNRVELEGVIAHELSHIKNYDIRFSTLVVVLVGVVALLSDFFMRSMWFGGGHSRDDDDNNNSSSGLMMIIAIVLAILAPFVAMLIQMALSRRREYLADANGALLTRYPEGLASALEKIASDPRPLASANKATASLYIYNPLKDVGGTINGLFNTHPPTEDRVKRLRAM